MIIEFTNRLNGMERIKYTPAKGSGAKLIDFLNKHSRFPPQRAGVLPNNRVERVGHELRIEYPMGHFYYRIVSDLADYDYEV